MPSPSERPPAQHRTAGLILAAGASRRLGRPKQLLPYGHGVLLDAVLATARDCGFDQTVLALGGSAAEVQRTVDTTGCDIVLNPDFGDGCSSSIAAGIAALHPDTDAVVLLLGDQPGVRAATARALLELLFTGSPALQGTAGRPGRPRHRRLPLRRRRRPPAGVHPADAPGAGRPARRQGGLEAAGAAGGRRRRTPRAGPGAAWTSTRKRTTAGSWPDWRARCEHTRRAPGRRRTSSGGFPTSHP